MREELGAGLGERERVARATEATSHLADGDVSVTHQHVEVAAYRRTGKLQLPRKIIDGSAGAPAQDVEDCLAAAF